MAEMTWGNLQTGGNGELTKTLKLKAGQNQVRLVSNPYECQVHWEDTVDGTHKRIVCNGPGCLICNAGHTPQKRFQVLVIDRNDGEVKILEGGNAIFNQIKTYAMDTDYGDPRNYDIKITKNGSGRDTRYTVVPSPKQFPLSDAEQKKVSETKTLAELNKPKSNEDLLSMNLEILQSLSNNTANDGWGEDDGWGSESNENLNDSNNVDDNFDSDDDWDNM